MSKNLHMYRTISIHTFSISSPLHPPHPFPSSLPHSPHPFPSSPSPSSLCTVSISFCKSAVTGPRSFRLEDLVGREGSGERQHGHAVGLHHRCARTTSVFHVLAGLLVAAEQVLGYLMLPATRGQQECQESGYHPGLRRRSHLERAWMNCSRVSSLGSSVGCCGWEEKSEPINQLQQGTRLKHRTDRVASGAGNENQQ